MKEKGRHSRESGSPGNLEEAEVPEMTGYSYNDQSSLDARLRGHDELRHSLQGEREFPDGNWLEDFN